MGPPPGLRLVVTVLVRTLAFPEERLPAGDDAITTIHTLMGWPQGLSPDLAAEVAAAARAPPRAPIVLPAVLPDPTLIPDRLSL